MKTFKLILIIAIIAVGALWLLFHKPQVAMPQNQDPATNVPTAMVTSIQPHPSNSTPQVAVNNNSENTNNIAAKYNQGLIGKDQAMQAVILEENKKSLDIYGKVIDQYGEPVAGAKVRGGILLNVSFVESGGEYHYTQTDSQGLFNFLGIHGVDIGIWPQKEGYYYNLKLPSQRPGDYRPDPNAPVIFTMWKIHGAEPLTSSDIDAKISHDGTQTTFDMATGKESSNGNLRVTFSRFPLEIRRRDKFDWAVKIEMLHGGLVEENDPYPYLAPKNGYQPFFELSVSTNDVAAWNPSLEKTFYIKNSQGQYGKMRFGVYSSLTPVRLQVHFTINPSGSQNLEPASFQ